MLGFLFEWPFKTGFTVVIGVTEMLKTFPSVFVWRNYGFVVLVTLIFRT